MASEARAHRVLGLAVPFALVGAYGGWVVGRILAGPTFDVSSLRLPPAAATIGVAAGLGAGVVVHQTAKRHIAERGDLDEAFLLVKAVVPAGAVAGALSLWVANAGGLLTSMVLGLLGALALYPLCLYVTRAAVQAGRARLGSLVAAADRRAMYGATAASLGAASLVEVHEWGVIDACWRPHAAQAWWSAHLATGVAVVAASVALAVLLAHLAALRRVARHQRELATMHEGDGPLPEDDPHRVDLGLGASCHRREAERGSAYRHHAETVAVLRGDPEAARRSLRRLVAHALVAVLLAGGALAAHLAASTRITSTTGCESIAPAWSPSPPSEVWYP